MAGAEDHAESATPVRGLHLGLRGNRDLDRLGEFIRDVLPREGVNLLVAQIDYSYAYAGYPRVSEPDSLTERDLRGLANACRDAGIELVPQINCLGHQSWAGRSRGLLRAFPEFDETPWIPQDAGRDVLYCRSYCPGHPRVHEVVLALIDELAEVCGAGKFHVGMDEVFLIAEDECPRCGGKDPADLFAREVSLLHDHLADRGVEMWMWGDRLINAAEFATGKWEGSANDTWPAVDAVPKDIVICDWHYERAFRTPRYFVDKGFSVVACPWQKAEVALEELEIMCATRRQDPRALGMLQTTWCGWEPFVRAYHGELPEDEKRFRNANGAARCFKQLSAALRGD